MKIVDGFMFYNELDILSYRLAILDRVVDYFIIAESTHTHAGKEKPLFFQENKERYSQYMHKIIHIVVDDLPYKFPNINYEKREQWKNENFQRNAIQRGFDKLKLEDEDLLIISDADEIPNPVMLEGLKKEENLSNFLGIIPVMYLYFYSLNKQVLTGWLQARIITVKNFVRFGFSPNLVRDLHPVQFTLVKDGGWHLSYFGDKYMIQNKHQNYAHQECNNESLTDLSKIQERIDNVKDPHDSNSKMIFVPVKDNKHLPPQYEVYLEKYYEK